MHTGPTLGSIVSHMPGRRVLLINPRATYVDEVAQKRFAPLNLLYLAAALRRQGFHPLVLDANAFRLDDARLMVAARRFGPAVVGVPVYSDILSQVRDLVRGLRRTLAPEAQIVLGGPHATAVPVQTMEQLPEADFLLTGEAERSLTLLCQALRQGAPELAAVPGIYLRAGGAVKAGALPVEVDVDAIAPPARDLLAHAYHARRYHALMVRRRPVDTVITSRGCPHSCGFCYTHSRNHRARAAHLVVQELARIRELGIRDVEICDDTFNLDPQRALDLMDQIIGARLDLSLRIKCRADTFDRALARKARQAGTYLVAFGMESGSQRMLDRMTKGTTVAHNARACQLTREHGMLCHTSWIIGYPGETPQTVHETVALIRRLRPSTANVGILRPYPGTRAWQLARDSGDLMGDWHPDHEAPWVRLPWATRRSTLERVRRRVLSQIYLSGHYALSFARQILSNANLPLAGYAAQETLRLLRGK